MKIKLPTLARTKVKVERDKIFAEMCTEGITNNKWDELNKRYQAYSEMLKPSWTITPDTLVIALTNIGGILLILNFEKIDILRSKAMSFVLRGRV